MENSYDLNNRGVEADGEMQEDEPQVEEEGPIDHYEDRMERQRATILSQSHIEKHLIRMEQARLNRECKQIIEDLKPGSGKIWQNKLTRPTVPNITGLKANRTTRDLRSAQGPSSSSITCLKRPITTQLASYESKKKRHNVYIKE